MLKKLVSPIGAIILIVSIGLATSYFTNKPIVEETNNAQTQALFATSFSDENGKTQALAQWKGKIIVLNFWATWCPPCREEMPELSELHADYQDQNVTVIGISIDDIASINEFTETIEITYPLLVAEESGMELAAALGNDKGALPYTLIIRPDGSISRSYFGRITKSLLEETLKTLL